VDNLSRLIFPLLLVRRLKNVRDPQYVIFVKDGRVFGVGQVYDKYVVSIHTKKRIKLLKYYIYNLMNLKYNAIVLKLYWSFNKWPFLLYKDFPRIINESFCLLCLTSQYDNVAC